MIRDEKPGDTHYSKHTLLKVKAIPPPITISSTRSSRFMISCILSFTFAPPSTARKGREGDSRACTARTQKKKEQGGVCG
jgi:hypothetical protein